MAWALGIMRFRYCQNNIQSCYTYKNILRTESGRLDKIIYLLANNQQNQHRQAKLHTVSKLHINRVRMVLIMVYEDHESNGVFNQRHYKCKAPCKKTKTNHTNHRHDNNGTKVSGTGEHKRP